ncbi:glycosyl transferase [Carboxydothermus islandicus]|uniref:Glycosyl transferase n=1 Tax=Carboxydothermus islandicus TaxID=661089 RepID=A0A1L8D547_9THEO|nr:glycosyltransferase [Carboxydothermus islandicus]GAV26217.1 glycosyl transferase [Carboxydothermus islandicus]
MKITLAISYFGSGGMEKVIERLAKMFVKIDLEVDIYIFGIKKSEIKRVKKIFLLNGNKVKIHILNNYRLPEKKAFWLFERIIGFIESLNNTKKYVFESRPDFIIAMDPWALNVFIVFRYFLKKIKVWSWLHFTLDVYKNSKFWMTNKYFLKKANGIFAICEAIKEQLSLEIPEQKNIVVTYNPIGELEERYIKRSKEPIFVYIGRFENHQKRLDYMIETFSKIKDLPWQLLMIGDGPDFNNIKRLVNELKLNNKIKLLGFKENPWEYVSEASAFILTSRYEGLPLVLIESLWYGLPVISTNCPTGPNEIVIDGVNGCLVPVNDKEKLIEILTKVIKREIAFKEPEEIRKTALKFTDEEVMKRILKAFKVSE